MKLNLSQFKKIKEDKQSATLQHPQGHQIKISKKALSTEMQNDLAKLPMHLAEGTPDQPVQNYSEEASMEQPKAAPSTVINIGQPAAAPQPVASMMPEMPAPMVPQAPAPMMPAPQAPPPMVAPAVQQPQVNQYAAQNDPYGSNAYGNISREGLQNQVQGIKEGAQAEGALNQAKAKVIDQGIDQQRSQLKAYQATNDNLRNEYGKFMSDYQNQHIDAQHYLNSLGTGQKVSTAIGLILGGMGGGLMHQANPALEFLNKQIANDIEAQKSNMDKQHNLLSANMAQFRNERDAMDMTSVMQRGIIASQLEQAAAKSSNPLIQARAKQAIGQLEVQNNQLLSQIAVRQTLQNQTQQPQANTQQGAMLPAQKIRLMQISGLISPEQQSAALKELGDAEEIRKARDVAVETFDKLNQINTIGNRVAHAGFTPASVEALRDNAAVGLARDIAGRVNEYEFAAAKDAFPAPGDSEQTLREKRKNLENISKKKMNAPFLNSIGINPFATAAKPQVQEGPPVGLK